MHSEGQPWHGAMGSNTQGKYLLLFGRPASRRSFVWDSLGICHSLLLQLAFLAQERWWGYKTVTWRTERETWEQSGSVGAGIHTTVPFEIQAQPVKMQEMEKNAFCHYRSPLSCLSKPFMWKHVKDGFKVTHSFLCCNYKTNVIHLLSKRFHPYHYNEFIYSSQSHLISTHKRKRHPIHFWPSSCDHLMVFSISL